MSSNKKTLDDFKGSEDHREDVSDDSSADDIILFEGCNPETLMDYLKALGVFKVLSEQYDKPVRGFWNGNSFAVKFGDDLKSDYSLNSGSEDESANDKDKDITKENLLDFFFEDYEPSPFLVPWSGSDFFGIEKPDDDYVVDGRKPPSGTDLITSFLATKSDRLRDYRISIKDVLKKMDDLNITEKSDINPSSTTKKSKKKKANFMKNLRSSLPEKSSVYLDVAALITDEKMIPNTVMGSGGGSDGRLDFGSNYMQCLWITLPDFKDQWEISSRNHKKFNSKEALKESLFNITSDEVTYIEGDTPGLFGPGRVGGRNATDGFRSASLSNPWDLILAIEGLETFAGAVSRKYSLQNNTAASFPFTCRLSAAGSGSVSESETGHMEIWLPIWNAPAKYKSVKEVFKRGRAEVSGRQAKNGSEFARSVASLGVDRGISSFRRYSLVKGRTGRNHTSVQLSVMDTPDKPIDDVHLLDDLDTWLGRLRQEAFGDGAVSEVSSRHVRQIEDAIFDYCNSGNTSDLQKVLREVGKAEKDISKSSKENNSLIPLSGLSFEWIDTCDDNSPEFRIACSLASIYDKDIGSIRKQMEPVERSGTSNFYEWSGNGAGVCWKGDMLCKSLSEILYRRLVMGEKKETDFTPIYGKVKVPLNDVDLFLSGQLNETKIIELLWGLVAIDWRETMFWEEDEREKYLPRWEYSRSEEISRLYAMTKIIYLPANLKYNSGEEKWRLTYDKDEGVDIPLSPHILASIRSGQISRAVRRTIDRLISSGLEPTIGRKRIEDRLDFVESEDIIDRLSAALLLPIYDINMICDFILKKDEE